MTGETAEEGREWVAPTDVSLMSKRYIDENSHFFLQPEICASFKGRRFLLASTDVHQNAIMILDQLLSLSGAVISNMGAENDPEEVALRAIKEGVEAILVSTHNGNALEYAQLLKKALGMKGAAIPVIMGGRLNQNIASEPLPVDVSNNLKTLGFIPCKQIDKPFHQMIAWETE